MNLFKRISAILLVIISMAGSVSAQTNVVITTSGTWTVPAGVYTVTVGCWGGGGGGGGAYTGACTGGSGGGGGAYSQVALNVTPGEIYNATIGGGGTAGSITGINGGAGGTTTFTGTGGTCSADGGTGGNSSTTSDWGTTKPGVAGAGTGIGFLYAGGNAGQTYHSSWSGSSGGGGGAGNGGAGGSSSGSGNSVGGTGGVGTYPGGAGASGWCCSINNKAGNPGNAPGGGGSGGSTGSCNSDPGHIGGVGGKGQVVVSYNPCPVGQVTATGAGTYCGFATLTAAGGVGGDIYFEDTLIGGNLTTLPGATRTVTASGTYYFRSFDGTCFGPSASVTVTITPGPCKKWLNQYCPTLPTGSYIDGGSISPVVTMQSVNANASPSSYGYVYWSFNASADSTYYFDLCSSAGSSGSSWLRLHNARNTSPSNNYCMDAGNTPTLELENRENGCIGTGKGLSKLIWTCTKSGTYYLESADGINPTFWGYNTSQSATLNYKTLPSYSVTCSDVFYDKGIDGTNGSTQSYNNNEDWIYTYYPTDTLADAISVQFVSFSTSPGDQLCVFDGNSINAPQIGCYAGPSITGTFSSTANNGSLTFWFTSDDSLISSGWQANVSCVASLNVRKNSLANSIVLFPNPAKNELSIQSSGLLITQIEIYNAVGEKIYSKATAPAEQFTMTIDVSAFPPGVYFVNAGGEKGKWNSKFVKQ